MGNFHILTDALCDLPEEWISQYSNITIVDTPITVSKGEESIVMHGLKPEDFPQVAAYVNKGYSAQTSCPDIYMAEEDNASFSVEAITRQYLDQGEDVLYIAMNGTLSSTFSHISSLYEELSAK